ncbi:MAG: hypothetical protein Q4F72_07945 [Desulfovibrionaceae bacterium]|nr:hypothetical protein [Desulfovibrionaceae bacterium]
MVVGQGRMVARQGNPKKWIFGFSRPEILRAGRQTLAGDIERVNSITEKARLLGVLKQSEKKLILHRSYLFFIRKARCQFVFL